MGRLSELFDTGVVVRFTSIGAGFVLTTVVVAVGATNTGNNGLYVLLSLLLAALVVSGILSRWNVEGISPDLEGPEEVFAGEPARFTVSLSNGARRRRRALLLKVGGAEHPLLFPEVASGRSETRRVDLVFSRRGRRRVEPLLLYSGWPLGLFRKGRKHASGVERVVFPSLLHAPVPSPDRRRAEGDRVRPVRRGRGFDVLSLREGMPGDDPRDVHWPQTARQGALIVRERAADAGRDVVVVLSGRYPEGEVLERAISEAAGLALDLAARGDRVGLALGNAVVPPGTGPAHRRSLLSALALASASDLAGRPPVLPQRSLVYRVEPKAAPGGSAR